MPNTAPISNSARDAIKRQLSKSLEARIDEVMQRRCTGSALQASYVTLALGVKLQVMSGKNAGTSVFEPFIGDVLNALGLGDSYYADPAHHDADHLAEDLDAFYDIECKFARQAWTASPSAKTHQIFTHIRMEEDKVFLLGWVRPGTDASEVHSGRELLELLDFSLVTRDEMREMTGKRDFMSSIAANLHASEGGRYTTIVDQAHCGNIDWLLSVLPEKIRY